MGASEVCVRSQGSLCEASAEIVSGKPGCVDGNQMQAVFKGDRSQMRDDINVTLPVHSVYFLPSGT